MKPLKPLQKSRELKSLVPPSTDATDTPDNPERWRSSGVAEKPRGCDACKYRETGAGFCGDDSPHEKRLMILCPAPTKGEILEQIPWRGTQGWIYTKFFLDEAEIPRNEVFISHVIRCRPPFKRFGGTSDSYPGGQNRRNAEFTCRQYDDSHTHHGVLRSGGIKTFAPDTYLVTFEPEKSLEVTAYKRIIQEDIKKAWRLVNRGRRVCVLMGSAPFELVGEGLHLEGGTKNWRGHYWSPEVPGWPFEPTKFETLITINSATPSGRRGFAAPKGREWRQDRIV